MLFVFFVVRIFGNNAANVKITPKRKKPQSHKTNGASTAKSKTPGKIYRVTLCVLVKAKTKTKIKKISFAKKKINFI